MKREQGGKVQRANIQAAKVLICPFFGSILRIIRELINSLYFFKYVYWYTCFLLAVKWHVYCELLIYSSDIQMKDDIVDPLGIATFLCPLV